MKSCICKFPHIESFRLEKTFKIMESNCNVYEDTDCEKVILYTMKQLQVLFIADRKLGGGFTYSEL